MSELQLTVSDELLETLAARVAELLAERMPSAPRDMSPWLDVTEAAAVYLRCKPKRVYDLVSQSRLPAHRDGSRLLFMRAKVDRRHPARGRDAGFAMPLSGSRPSAIPRLRPSMHCFRHTVASRALLLASRLTGSPSCSSTGVGSEQPPKKEEIPALAGDP